MRKLTVVYAINDLCVGGAQRQFIEQAKLFDTERFRLVLIALFKLEGRADLYGEVPPHIEIHHLSFSGFLDIGSWWCLFRILRHVRPDVVLSNLFFSNTVFRMLKRFVGYAMVVCEHNTLVHKPRWQRHVDRMLARGTHRIVAVSNTVADFTSRQEGIPRDRFTVIRNGVNLAEARARLQALPPQEWQKRSLGVDPNHLLIVNTARLVAQKNHRLLIEGLATFRLTRPDARLLIVGDGPLRPELERLAEALDQKDAVIFAGYQPDVWPYYKAANLFASTSHIEGLSISYLEALAAGLPLVSTKTSGTDELVEEGKNGTFIEEFTPEAVAAALLRAARGEYPELAQTVAPYDLAENVRAYERLLVEASSARMTRSEESPSV